MMTVVVKKIDSKNHKDSTAVSRQAKRDLRLRSRQRQSEKGPSTLDEFDIV